MDKELRKLQNLLEGQEITSIEKNKLGMVRLVAENGYALCTLFLQVIWN